MKKTKLLLSSLIIPPLSTLVIPVVSCSKSEPAPDTMMVDLTHNLTFTADGTVTGLNKSNVSELVIPEYLTNESANSPYKGYKVSITTIGEDAFHKTNLTKVTIPDSVKTIEWGAFGSTQLTEVIIPNSVEYLSGFNGIKTLTQITIPSSVKTIGKSAFYNTPLTSITIPDSVEVIRTAAFENTNLTEVIIPDSVKEIGITAFKNTKITQVTLPADCKYDSSAFPSGCQVTGGIRVN